MPGAFFLFKVIDLQSFLLLGHFHHTAHKSTASAVFHLYHGIAHLAVIHFPCLCRHFALPKCNFFVTKDTLTILYVKQKKFVL